MKIGSLCTGIAGLDLAAELVFGGEVAWCAEIDPDASAVLAARYPGVANIGSARRPSWDDVERVDIITAGYPCQPFSLAGKRKGHDDPRHLWPDIAEAIRQLRPGWVVLENVPGHVSLGFDTVLADLASLGFDAEWIVVPAAAVGACHKRERLYVLASNADSFGRRSRPGLRQGHSVQHGAIAAGAGGPAADASGVALGAQPVAQPGSDGAMESRPATQAPADTWGKYADAVARWEAALGRPAPAPLVDGRLNPELTEWMMGYPAGWVTNLGLKRPAQLRLCGNAVVPQAAAYALGILLERIGQ